MIAWISNPGEDYSDSIFYVLKKTYGDKVITYPDKPNYYESQPNLLNCHYDFKRTPCTKNDIIAANKIGTLTAVFILSSGYKVWPDWTDLREELYKDGKKFPVIIIDGADGDRIQYSPDDWDLYFAREYHLNNVRHEHSHYPEFQIRALVETGRPPKGVWPLPFSIIPEKFNTTPIATHYNRDVFFRGAYGKQRAALLEGINIPNSLIDIHTHTPIHQQNREAFYRDIRDSKICLNITAGGNDCMRFWELLGAGGFVLTEKHDQVIEPAFQNYIHLDNFSTREEMLDKIQFYLTHENIRERMRLQGYQFAMTNHTCYNRLTFIQSKLKEIGYEL